MRHARRLTSTLVARSGPPMTSLPPDSPLWDLPNVLVTPHNALASAGNEHRAAELFLANLGRWARGAALLNEHTA